MRATFRPAIGALLLAAAAVVCGTGASVTARSQPAPPAACGLTDVNATWIQRGIEGWELVRRDFLRLDEGPLPWIVLFDASCAWHLAPDARLLPDASPIQTTLVHAGRPVEVRVQPHAGTVLLPNRVEVPAAVKASTALYRNGRAPFFSMSLPSVWRSDPAHAKRQHLDEYLLGVMVHEMTHSRQLVTVNRALRELIKDAGMPGRLNDDVIQVEFQRVSGFARAFERERDLFYEAAQQTDAARRATTAYRALSMVRERHDRYFTGSNRVYEQIESLFLTLEGVGQWAAYRLLASRGQPDALRMVRDNRKYWSQDEGLALFLLLDAMVPEWQRRIFAPNPASPFDLLSEAIRQQTRR